jgi:hypothetical protein
VDQTKNLMHGDVNPFKKGAVKAPFSANYRKILEGRKKLPVFDKMQEFFDVVSLLGAFLRRPYTHGCVCSFSLTRIKSSLSKVKLEVAKPLSFLSSSVTVTCRK